MDFFINHIGWFVGIFFIGLFAIVGYYAEKKEQNDAQNKNNSNNDTIGNIDSNTQNNNTQEPFIENYIVDDQNVTKIENTPIFGDDDFIYKEKNVEKNEQPADYSIDVDGTNVVNSKEGSLSELEWDGNKENTEETNNLNPENNESSEAIINLNTTTDDTNITNDNLQNIDNNLNEINNNSDITANDLNIEVMSPDVFANVEDIHMTLDDLENKNDLDITNDSLGVTTSDDGFIDDYSNEYEFDNDTSEMKETTTDDLETISNASTTEQNMNLEPLGEMNDTTINNIMNYSDNEIKETTTDDNIENASETENTTDDLETISNASTTEQNMNLEPLEEMKNTSIKETDDITKLNNDIESTQNADDIINRIVFSDEVTEPVPEIENNTELNNSLDLYNDNTSDDIWKF